MKNLRIIGPTKIEELKKGKKRILLVSDVHYHFKKQGCGWSFTKNKTTTPEFLDKLIRNGEGWDIYIESSTGRYSFLAQKYYPKSFYKKRYEECLRKKIRPHDCPNMMLVFDYFASKGCFLKEKCEYEGARFHFADIRQKKFSKTELNNRINSLGFFINFAETYYENLEEKSLEIGLEEHLNDFMKTSRALSKYFNKSSKIVKQLKFSNEGDKIFKYYYEAIETFLEYYDVLDKRLKSKVVRKRVINKFIDGIKKLENFDDFKKKYNLMEIVKEILGKEEEKILNSFEKIRKFLTNHYTFEYNEHSLFFQSMINFIFNVLSMDVYVLARIFRDFDKKPQNNVVIIAGAAHIKNYQKYLKFRKFKTDFVSKPESKRCQIIPDITV